MWGKAFRNDAIMFQNPEACMTCTTLLNPSCFVLVCPTDSTKLSHLAGAKSNRL